MAIRRRGAPLDAVYPGRQRAADASVQPVRGVAPQRLERNLAGGSEQPNPRERELWTFREPQRDARWRDGQATPSGGLTAFETRVRHRGARAEQQQRDDDRQPARRDERTRHGRGR